MSKGKHGAAVNARLRDEAKQSQEARRRLEARLERAERDRDEALARLMRIEESEHPAITAERERADHAAAIREQAVLDERAKWIDLIERSRRSVIELAKVVSQELHHAKVYSPDSIEALAELYGQECWRYLPGSNRDMRRNAMSGAQVRRIAGLKDNNRLKVPSHSDLRERLGLADPWEARNG